MTQSTIPSAPALGTDPASIAAQDSTSNPGMDAQFDANLARMEAFQAKFREQTFRLKVSDGEQKTAKKVTDTGLG